MCCQLAILEREDSADEFMPKNPMALLSQIDGRLCTIGPSKLWSSCMQPSYFCTPLIHTLSMTAGPAYPPRGAKQSEDTVASVIYKLLIT
ncbi:predicted protein [Sclerotinia sclerotiorum 1980 UF-70]|uniref:Uncharacterized protein n=1 Tax=Sclerotinia sclerotiorum (strain ATCC 18683 / 1980 / Ss-1) TaxID=665079 RepID=A7EGQ3_SCLS1|nr:predicted protein [Sclerotinia sclerotiorum 1980 UF-70]EDO02019.1 predicted protein [Sclerotinia sclerotiorum 1980 UF-70]